MSATNAFETALLQHLFQNAAIANVGDASGLLFKGALTSSLAVSSGITPQFAIGDLDINVD